MKQPRKIPSQRGSIFPIVEAYGFPYDSSSSSAHEAWEEQRCPFMGNVCEKKRQYDYGYCSVTYSAQWDEGRQHPYAVCDHRLDGEPIDWAVRDHFGSAEATLVPEVTAVSQPKLNVDYVAYRDDPKAPEGTDLIAIEAQAIDLRGGGVGPAWRAWEDGNLAEWRRYFTEEAIAKKRKKDTIDYGVNMGNVYKRLGTQVAVKGEFLKQVQVPFYVVTQHRILQQLRSRVDFDSIADGEPWDITFVSFDYTGLVEDNGQLSFVFHEVVRTTLPMYLRALTSSGAVTTYLRSDFISKVRKKDGRPRGRENYLL
ncbi:hypothetical protein ACFYUR_31735 [Micromonospora haikouensis]|uniref:hypothetical protein n=1 Tax=Micromonospora haikouensis TaxID=686309 RepID=UPI00368F46B6